MPKSTDQIHLLMPSNATTTKTHIVVSISTQLADRIAMMALRDPK